MEGKRDGAIEFRVDSTYAKNIATGTWMPKKGAGRANRDLAVALRRAYRNLHASRPVGFVRIAHVRAHMGEKGNEAADRLAKRGATLPGIEYEREGYEGEESARDTPPADAGMKPGNREYSAKEGGRGKRWDPKRGDG